MARIRPVRLTEQSAYIDEPCALCQERFVVGDKLVICPEDRVRHHAACWEANGNHCVALGCTGEGRVSWHTAAEEQMVEESGFAIGEDDPLLDPANVPDRPIPRGPSWWKGLSKSFRGCLLAGCAAVLVLCILFTILGYLLIEGIWELAPQVEALFFGFVAIY